MIRRRPLFCNQSAHISYKPVSTGTKSDGCETHNSSSSLLSTWYSVIIAGEGTGRVIATVLDSIMNWRYCMDDARPKETVGAEGRRRKGGVNWK